MKKYFILLLLFWSSLHSLEFSELKTKLIEAGKPYDLSLTLLAIAKVESNYGQVKVNLQDPSCGVTMVHLKFFLKRYNIEDTPLKRNFACQRLMNNDDLAIAEAVAILTYWKTKLCGKWGCTSSEWENVWGAYNAGKRYDGKAGVAYSKKIRKVIKELKKDKEIYLSILENKERRDHASEGV